MTSARTTFPRTGFPTKYGYSVVGRDGRSMLGEKVLVLDQGIVGLLTTALLALHPLTRLITLDRHPLRLNFSLTAGADTSLDPAEPGAITALAGHGSPKIYPASPGPDGGWRNA